MKKTITIILSLLIITVLTGCEQFSRQAGDLQTEAQKLRQDAEQAASEAALGAEQLTKEAMEAKEGIEEKVGQVQDAAKETQEAADALKKLSE